MLPDSSLAFHTLGVPQGAFTGVSGEALLSMTHKCLAEVANSALEVRNADLSQLDFKRLVLATVKAHPNK